MRCGKRDEPPYNESDSSVFHRCSLQLLQLDTSSAQPTMTRNAATRPADIYAQALLHLGNGVALYEPSPHPNDPTCYMRIGDVGFVDNGHFIRVFNLFRDEDHRINKSAYHSDGTGTVPNSFNEPLEKNRRTNDWGLLSTRVKHIKDPSKVATVGMTEKEFQAKTCKKIGAGCGADGR